MFAAVLALLSSLANPIEMRPLESAPTRRAGDCLLAIDGRDMIVLPGFVDTHWHMWNTLLRSMAGDKRELGYFPTVATLGKLITPDDM